MRLESRESRSLESSRFLSFLWWRRFSIEKEGRLEVLGEVLGEMTVGDSRWVAVNFLWRAVTTSLTEMGERRGGAVVPWWTWMREGMTVEQVTGGWVLCCQAEVLGRSDWVGGGGGNDGVAI